MSVPQRAAALRQIMSNGSLDLPCIDFLSIEPDFKSIANILVITDQYTRYAQAFPTNDQKALTAAKVLFEKFLVHYGLPARIHSDQGRDFEIKIKSSWPCLASASWEPLPTISGQPSNWETQSHSPVNSRHPWSSPKSEMVPAYKPASACL